MSALDEVVSRFPFDASDNVSRETHDRFLVEARAELELLRDRTFRDIKMTIDANQQRFNVDKWGAITEQDRDLLRTDPERARRMGLGWAL